MTFELCCSRLYTATWAACTLGGGVLGVSTSGDANGVIPRAFRGGVGLVFGGIFGMLSPVAIPLMGAASLASYYQEGKITLIDYPTRHYDDDDDDY